MVSSKPKRLALNFPINKFPDYSFAIIESGNYRNSIVFFHKTIYLLMLFCQILSHFFQGFFQQSARNSLARQIPNRNKKIAILKISVYKNGAIIASSSIFAQNFQNSFLLSVNILELEKQIARFFFHKSISHYF